MAENPLASSSLGKRLRIPYENGIFSNNVSEWTAPTRLRGVEMNGTNITGDIKGPLNMSSNPQPRISNRHDPHKTDVSINVSIPDIGGSGWPKQNMSGYLMFVKKDDNEASELNHFFNLAQLNALLEEGYYASEIANKREIVEDGESMETGIASDRSDFHVLPVFSRLPNGRDYISTASMFRRKYNFFGVFSNDTTIGDISETLSTITISGRTSAKNVFSEGFMSGDSLAVVFKVVPRMINAVLNEKGERVADAPKGDPIPQVYGVNLGGNKHVMGNTNREVLDVFNGKNLNFGALASVQPRESDYEYYETIYIKGENRTGGKGNTIVLNSLEFAFTQVIGRVMFSRGQSHLSQYIPGFTGMPSSKRLKSAHALSEVIRSVHVMKNIEDMEIVLM